jgi:hypothetical protein
MPDEKSLMLASGLELGGGSEPRASGCRADRDALQGCVHVQAIGPTLRQICPAVHERLRQIQLPARLMIGAFCAFWHQGQAAGFALHLMNFTATMARPLALEPGSIANQSWPPLRESSMKWLCGSEM